MQDIDKHGHRKIKICVSGAAETGHCGVDALDRAKELGKEIAMQGAVLVSGATTGFPLWAAMGAKEAGGMCVGLSPAASEKEHVEVYKLPLDYMDLIIYTGFGYVGRDLMLVRASDAVICGCGRIGTIHEFTIAFEDNKPIGVYEGPWETDSVIQNIYEKSHRTSQKLFFNEDPKKMVEEIKRLASLDKAGEYKV